MKAWTAAILLALAAGLAPAAPPATPAPGEYATQPGGGTLSVRRNGRGTPEFSLFVVGANAHTCALGGWIENGLGEVAGDARCRIRLAVQGANVEVSALDAACRDYCGMRAGFEGRYVRLPAACVPAERDRRGAAFLADFRARRYGQAHATVLALQRDCGAFLDWIARDALANDRAMVELQLHRPQACLEALKDTRGATLASEAALRGELAPADVDSYLPVARATWAHLRRCRAALAPGTGSSAR